MLKGERESIAAGGGGGGADRGGGGGRGLPDGLIAGILFLVKVIFPLNFGREAATQRVAHQHNSHHARAQNHQLSFRQYETLLKVGELVPTYTQTELFSQKWSSK